MNYKELADDALDVSKNTNSVTISADFLARANVYAALELAEQQRTASLIAWCTAGGVTPAEHTRDLINRRLGLS